MMLLISTDGRVDLDQLLALVVGEGEHELPVVGAVGAVDQVVGIFLGRLLPRAHVVVVEVEDALARLLELSSKSGDLLHRQNLGRRLSHRSSPPWAHLSPLGKDPPIADLVPKPAGP